MNGAVRILTCTCTSHLLFSSTCDTSPTAYDAIARGEIRSPICILTYSDINFALDFVRFFIFQTRFLFIRIEATKTCKLLQNDCSFCKEYFRPHPLLLSATQCEYGKYLLFRFMVMLFCQISDSVPNMFCRLESIKCLLIAIKILAECRNWFVINWSQNEQTKNLV